MKIIDRYILKEIFIFFSISLFAFTSMLLTIRLLKFASLIINKGVAFSQILMVFVSIIPTFLEVAIPMATLLGVMLTFARLSGDSEIVVMRASGISLNQLIKPVLIFGIAAGSVSLYVSLKLRPWGYRSLAYSLFEIARTKSVAGLSEGMFNKLGQLTLYAEKIDNKTGKMHHVLIDNRRNNASRKIVVGKTGYINSNKKEKTIVIHLKDGEIHEINEGKYTTTSYITNSIVLDPEELYDSNKKKGRKKRELTIPELNKRIKSFMEQINNQSLQQSTMNKSPQIGVKPPVSAKKTPLEHLSKKELWANVYSTIIEKGRRFSMPFASFILALVAMPLGIIPPRTQKTWGAGLSALIGMVVFVVYYCLLSIGMALGQTGNINPYLGLWLPNIAATVVAAVTLSKMSTEQWRSISDGAQEIAAFCLKKLNFTAGR